MKYALEVVNMKENYSYALISDCGSPYLRNETSIYKNLSHSKPTSYQRFNLKTIDTRENIYALNYEHIYIAVY